MLRVRQTNEFADWIGALADRRARGRIAARIVRIQSGNLGDCRSVGSGVSELRVDVGPGYRVYFTIRQRELVILLCGGDKGSQRRDIVMARRLAGEI